MFSENFSNTITSQKFSTLETTVMVGVGVGVGVGWGGVVMARKCGEEP
jgi:hypothetical protein